MKREIPPPKDNPRTVRDDAALQELAASVKAQGVLEPGIARPLDGGLVELCAGSAINRE
ncbi:MAG: ParB N-terminal domain-containing protein [Verrucomicrobiota bacterium]|nr:ParB N-terminal domain-containing protein [Verrucomicrobiota bacterium]